MKITLCGSLAFQVDMEAIATVLRERGHEVKLPPSRKIHGDGREISAVEYHDARKHAETEPWVVEGTHTAMKAHFEKIVWADAVLVVNKEKNGVPGYIGGNSFLEMGIAFFLQKELLLLHPIPELPYSEEIRGMKPRVIASLHDL